MGKPKEWDSSTQLPKINLPQVYQSLNRHLHNKTFMDYCYLIYLFPLFSLSISNRTNLYIFLNFTKLFESNVAMHVSVSGVSFYKLVQHQHEFIFSIGCKFIISPYFPLISITPYGHLTESIFMTQSHLFKQTQ